MNIDKNNKKHIHNGTLKPFEKTEFSNRILLPKDNLFLSYCIEKRSELFSALIGKRISCFFDRINSGESTVNKKVQSNDESWN